MPTCRSPSRRSHEPGGARRELIRPSRDGSEVWADPLREEQRMTTERVGTEQRLVAQYAVSRTLAESDSLDASTPQILDAIGLGLGWDYAALWLVDEQRDVLVCGDTWHALVVEFPEFESISQRISFATGVGLPGRVWASGEPVWIADIARDANFARLRVAASEGLHTAMAFPILFGRRFLGVFEFLGREIREPDPDILDMLVSLGSQIGQFARRTRAEAAVRESEARKAAILESALDAIVTMNHEGRVIEWNPAAQRIFGYTSDEVVDREMAELILPPALRQAHRRGLKHYVSTGEGPIIGKRLELTAMRSDGFEFPVELTVTRIPVDGPPTFTGYIRDITERKLALEQLKRSEASLAEAQRIAHLGSWEWDLLTDEVRWSDETYRIYGITPCGFAPTADIFWQLVHPQDLADVRQAVRSTLEENQPYDIEHRIVRPDGTERVVHRQGEVIREAAGKPVRMVGTVLDVTERSRALEQAERALELRNHFLSMASHELKTPVTLLKGYAQLLRNQADRTGDAMLRKPVGVIERQVGRIHRLVDELLDVSHVEGGRIKSEMLPFDLSAAVLEVVDELQATAPGVELQVHERAGGLRVLGDRARIQQVVTNLLINAVKYSGNSKQVDIVLSQHGDRAQFSVTDYGIGIPEEQQGRVFELYFRGSNAPGGNYGGLGLGLYIGNAIVEQHGGEIGMVSEEGKGSTFHVSLPLADTNPSDRELQS